MSNPNINIGVVNESSVSSQTQVGKILFTDQGNQYIVKSDGNKLKITDIITVDTLPTIGQPLKIYILNSNGTYTMNIYDTSWHVISGSSSGGTSFTDWTSSTNYTANTGFVIYNNLLYRCNTTHTSGTNFDFTKWQYIGNTDTKSINGITVDDSNRSNGRVLTYNNSTNTLQFADVNITGIVGSTQITTISNTTIESGAEIVFNHPISTNIVPVIEEQIVGSSVTDTHIDFSDINKYTLQDSTKILFNSNKVKLLASSSCIANYKLEETSGTTCIDSKGANNGTYNGTTSVTGSVGNARSFNGTSDYISFSNYVIPTGKKTVKFKMKCPLNSANYMIVFDNCDWNFSNKNGFSSYINKNGSITFGLARSSVSSVFSISSDINVCDNNWHTIMLTWDGTTSLNGVKLYIDDLTSPIANATANGVETLTPSYNLRIGQRNLTISSTNYNGQLDEIEIYNDVINPFLSPTYVQTTGASNYSLITIDTVTSLTIPITIPTNTSIKCLFSVDNKTNWLYYDGTSIKKFTGDLTQDWSNYNLYTDLQTYFTNLSITQLTSDLNSLGIIPISLDLCFQLKTQDVILTPSISAITMTYTTISHNEFASIGTFSDSSTYGVKRVSNSSLSVKNKSAITKMIKLSVVTSA